MRASKKRGVFITLEGIDGTGKSTQHRLLVTHLRERGYPVCATREPGGTRVGERIRSVLLARPSEETAAESEVNRSAKGDLAPGPLAELLLMYAARAQHLQEVVRPALARGDVVVSDRFNDASLAYQGYGRKLGLDLVRRVDQVVCGPTQPDLTIVLDLDSDRALERARERDTRGDSSPSRFEREGREFQARVRAGYRALARQDPRRVKLVRADRPVEQVQSEIRTLVDALLEGTSKSKVKGQKSKAKKQKSGVKTQQRQVISDKRRAGRSRL